MANEARHIQPVGAKRGSYLKLNPQFAEIVDFFCSSEEDADRLSDSSIRSSASKATQFLYYLQGMNIVEISVLLGHEQLATTMRYLDISTDDQIKAIATLDTIIQ